MYGCSSEWQLGNKDLAPRQYDTGQWHVQGTGFFQLWQVSRGLCTVAPSKRLENKLKHRMSDLHFHSDSRYIQTSIFVHSQPVTTVKIVAFMTSSQRVCKTPFQAPTSSMSTLLHNLLRSTLWPAQRTSYAQNAVSSLSSLPVFVDTSCQTIKKTTAQPYQSSILVTNPSSLLTTHPQTNLVHVKVSLQDALLEVIRTFLLHWLRHLCRRFHDGNALGATVIAGRGKLGTRTSDRAALGAGAEIVRPIKAFLCRA